ncbi:MAG: hypothetical protein AB7S70_02810 [Hyphomicrobium sp.]|uniref:hypothetical protein n=1 Tax=Hyphomicrobium sp. TaxID=82 RepID=UPI003D0D8FD4
MDRREFLVTSGGAAVAATSGAACAQAEAAPPVQGTAGTVLRLSMPWADTPQGPADSVRRLARRFEAMTGGRTRIEIVASESVPDSDADLMHGSAHDFAPHHPAFCYFAGLPGSAGLAPQDLAHWMAIGGGQMLWDDLAGEAGWKPFLAGHMGDAPPLWSREPVRDLGDLAGRRIAAPGLGADVARALGAEALAVAEPRAAAALLAEGTLDAAEAGDLATSLATGVARAARHATGAGLNGHGTALALSVKLAVWERMADTDKTALAAAAAEEYQIALGEGRAHAAVARSVLEGSLGIAFAAWPADVAEALERVAEATIAHVAGRDATAARIDHSYMAFRSLLSGAPAPRRPQAVA